MPYGSVQAKSPISKEYIEVGFPYSFPIRFADAKAQRDEDLSTYGSVVNRYGLDDEYDTTQTRSGLSSY